MKTFIKPFAIGLVSLFVFSGCNSKPSVFSITENNPLKVQRTQWLKLESQRTQNELSNWL